MDLQPLFDALREACPSNVWDQGVRYFRADVVVGQEIDDDEIRLHVRVGGRPTPYEIHLWPEDEDWSCDCGHEEGCSHAVAALLAQRAAVKSGKTLPKPEGGGSLRYTLTRDGAKLSVRREILRGQAVEKAPKRLRGVRGLNLLAGDLEVDDTLSLGMDPLPATGWARMLRAWTDAGTKLHLDQDTLTTSDELVTPIAVLKDHGVGFRMTLHRDGRVVERFNGGVCRIGDALHPESGGGLSPIQRRKLVEGLVYPPEDAGKLVSEVIPRLEQQIPVRIKTSRLPTGEVEPPRLQLELLEKDGRLQVRMDIVYGDPISGRVVGNELVLTGEGVIPLRDRIREVQLLRKSEGMRLPVGRTWSYEQEDAIAFTRDRLRAFTGQVVGHAGAFSVRDSPAQLALHDGELQSDADLKGLVQAWIDGESLVPLIGGGFAPMPDMMAAHGHVIADLVAAKERQEKLPIHALPALAELAEALDSPPPADLERLRPLLDEDLPEEPLPDVNATLRPYQLVGFQWLRFLMRTGLGGILADDMGLGKTLQALCAIKAAGGKALVVAPTSVLGNWLAEAVRFFPGTTTNRFHGPRRRLKDVELTVTSYALLRLDPKLLEQDWTTVVLDEAQAIKNPTSQTAQAAFKLRAEHRLSLTGTPIENRLDELWAQLHFVMPGFLGGRKSFQERYARPVEAGDPRAAKALRKRIKPFVLRRMKTEVATDLPNRTDILLPCPMPAEQQTVYDAVHAAATDDVARLIGDGQALQVLELLLRLRQAACHPRLLPGDRPDVSGKLDILLNKLKDLSEIGHRSLVFSQWTSFLDLIEQGLAERGIPLVRLDGSTSDRDGVVRRFQAADGPPVFLLSLKAGGTGLNLTAADYVFHTDPWWNPAVEDQAVDRAHRIGQDKPVVSVKLISEGTVEERIVALQDKKRAIARAALGEGVVAGGLTRDDILELLR
ncbi:MAG: DEAD/DEAH box helicase [Proteobacteria bacterium]|nr:DEAD/DEAH box helicase [Pseudomonadota bacterium]MCP4916239.1 DEAD/DEAH box helicase [Pseudomonadota bacterium]